MKFSSILLRLREHFEPLAEGIDAELVQRDPLAHPSLSRMSQRELGDMPFDGLRSRAARPSRGGLG